MLRFITTAIVACIPTGTFATSIHFLINSEKFEVVAEESNLYFSGCDKNEEIKVSNLIFICDSDEWDRGDGKARLLSKIVEYKGNRFRMSYLCVEEMDDCISGTILDY